MRDAWVQQGWQDSALSYPVSDVRGSGRRESGTFERGTIVWTSATGAVIGRNID